MAMEFDSIWDEGFFSMLSEDLDYEFDENDLFENPLEGPVPDNHQGAIKKEDYRQLSNFVPNSDCNSTCYDKKALVQAELEGKKSVYNASFSLVSENKFALMNTTSYTSFTQDSANITTTSNASHGFADGGNIVKTEIKRRNSIESDFVNTDEPIIIDARIFLDSYNTTKKHEPAVPTSFNNPTKLNSNEISTCQDQREKLVKRNKSSINVNHKSSKINKSDNAKINHKSDNKGMKLRNCVINNDGNKCVSRKEKDVSEKANKKRKYCSNSQNENLVLKDANTNLKTADKERQPAYDDDKKAESKYSNKEKKSKSSHEPLIIKTETNQNKHASSVHSSNDKQRSKVRICKTSDAEKYKQVGSDRSTLDRKCKTEKVQVKVESNVEISHSARKKEFDSLELQPNVTSDTEKENVDVKQSSLKLKTEKPNAKKGFPQTPDEQECPVDKKSISLVKRENGHLANMKVESTWREYPLHPKLVLNRLPDYILHGLSVCTEFLSPKEEILDQKSNLRLNPLHLPKARIVLKKLSKDDLQCSEKFLSRVKSEINSTVARKLKSQGKAREKNFIQRFCCKCKSLQVDRDGLSKTKYCENCGFQLIYLCFKCNEKHYVDYNHAFRHLKICRGSGETKSFGLDSIVLHRCTECTFKTTYTKIMAVHVKTKGHKADGELDIEKVLKKEKVRVKREGKSKDAKKKGKSKKREGKDDKPEVSDMPKLPRNKYADFIINQNKTSVAEITERYCAKCNKPRSSKTRKLAESCNKCKARLQLRCLKCHQKWISYDVMLKHLRSMCCPNSYRCAKCNHEGSIWTMMQQHFWEKHRNASNRPSKSRREKRRKEVSNSSSKSRRAKRSKEGFHCELCTFKTNYKYSVDRHMKAVHKK